MSAPAVFWDIRYRPAGSQDEWVTERIPVGAEIRLTGVQRGVTYEGEASAVSATGRRSSWRQWGVTVASTNRTGAAALPVNSIANQASGWDMDTSVEYLASTDGSGHAEAVITVSSGSLIVGDVTVTYAASSGSVVGEPGTQRRVYLYYDDPRLQGGVRALGIADTIVESMRGAGRVAIGNVTLAFPQIGDPPISGGGGIGGGGGSGGAHVSPEEVPL